MIRRLLVLLAVFAATAIGTVVVSAPSAQAVPYPPVVDTDPSITASVYDPCAGASNVIGGRGFLAAETVELALDGREIGRPVVAADGTFQITVTIPPDARGAAQVTATGLTSGRRASLTLDISCTGNQDGNGGGSNGTGFGAGGSLASTGAAIGGVVLLGAVLFGVGAMLTVAGRRRRGTTS